MCQAGHDLSSYPLIYIGLSPSLLLLLDRAQGCWGEKGGWRRLLADPGVCGSVVVRGGGKRAVFLQSL